MTSASRDGRAEFMGSNPVEDTLLFQVSLRDNCLNCPDDYENYFSISSRLNVVMTKLKLSHMYVPDAAEKTGRIQLRNICVRAFSQIDLFKLKTAKP